MALFTCSSPLASTPERDIPVSILICTLTVTPAFFAAALSSRAASSSTAVCSICKSASVFAYSHGVCPSTSTGSVMPFSRSSTASLRHATANASAPFSCRNLPQTTAPCP